MIGLGQLAIPLPRYSVSLSRLYRRRIRMIVRSTRIALWAGRVVSKIETKAFRLAQDFQPISRGFSATSITLITLALHWVRRECPRIYRAPFPSTPLIVPLLPRVKVWSMDDETGRVARNWGVAYLSLLSRRYLPYLRLFAAGPLLSSAHFISLVLLPLSHTVKTCTTRPDIFY